MKKLVNKPEDVVFEMLDGLVAANPGKFTYVRDKKIIAPSVNRSGDIWPCCIR